MTGPEVTKCILFLFSVEYCRTFPLICVFHPASTTAVWHRCRYYWDWLVDFKSIDSFAFPYLRIARICGTVWLVCALVGHTDCASSIAYGFCQSLAAFAVRLLVQRVVCHRSQADARQGTAGYAAKPFATLLAHLSLLEFCRERVCDGRVHSSGQQVSVCRYASYYHTSFLYVLIACQ